MNGFVCGNVCFCNCFVSDDGWVVGGLSGGGVEWKFVVVGVGWRFFLCV